MSPTTSPTRRAPAARTTSQKCSGPCGRRLPLSAFGVDSRRKTGRRSECKDCRRERTGPRSKEAQQARALEKELWVIRETYSGVPALADILSRTLEEVGRVGVFTATLDEQVEAVRRAVLIQGCRSADEVIDDTGLSRKAVDRALEKLVADKVLETRDRYLLKDEASKPGRPVTEYHPADTPRGEVFTHILDRSRDDHLL